MLMKILLKIWPALTPIFIYICWQLFLKKLVNKIFRSKADLNQHNIGDGERVIEAEFCKSDQDLKTDSLKNLSNKKQKSGKEQIFSLSNKNFVIIIYINLIAGVLCIISFAL